MIKENNQRMFESAVQQVQFDLCEQEAESVQDIEHFKLWTQQYVRPLISHEALACVHGLIYGVGISLDYVVTIDYPVEHLESIRNAAGHMDTPLARRWYEERKPIFFDENNPSGDVSDTWLKKFRHSQLKNAAADGVIDTEQCIATYFSFHRLPQLNEEVILGVFEKLIPVMHQTFTRVISKCKRSRALVMVDFNRLTTREQEIAMWVGRGKTNMEVAQILTLTENTVKNHVSRILHKTGCNSRAVLTVSSFEYEHNRFGNATRVL